MMTSGKLRALHRKACSAMSEYKKIKVSAIRTAVKKQIASRGPANAIKPVTKAFGQTSERVQDVDDVFSAREKLLTMLERAKRGATLGPFLLGLSCEDYAYFMWAMYGHWYMANPAVSTVNGIVTPTVDTFTDANAMANRPALVKYVRLFRGPGSSSRR